MKRRRHRCIEHDAYRRRGAATVEFAIVLPVLLLCFLGLVEFGRAIWTQATLDYVVQAAARCAAVDPITCGTAAQTQQFAADKSPGIGLSSSVFTVTNAGCGTQVSASVDFEFVLSTLFPYSRSLTASACFPT